MIDRLGAKGGAVDIYLLTMITSMRKYRKWWTERTRVEDGAKMNGKGETGDEAKVDGKGGTGNEAKVDDTIIFCGQPEM